LAASSSQDWLPLDELLELELLEGYCRSSTAT
jgi:hypothetical protein